MPAQQIKFGTDGWRGIIADDFTFGNVRRVAQGTAQYMKSRSNDPLAIIGYDSHAKVYTSYYASSVGLVGAATGSVNGNTWTWMVEDKFAGKAIKGRTTITMSSPTQYTIKYEMADEKGGYTTITEGTTTKENR